MGIRDCPAAVSGNDRRHTHWVRRTGPGKRRPIGVQAIDDLDADVISLEAARSHMQVARELAAHGYPREAGPGVYDIHSPRVPSPEEAAELLRTGLKAIPAERLWVNPDCGLKTRGWPETRSSLESLVHAVRTVREELSPS